ncbi:hypothetical protein [Streptomyces sp. WM6368]|uniref:hypothetical protein n=1 Tax=Streptomyces sp. WM6368 TaxID=1415554 RepID=UPI0006AECFD0|nr:hypothetical protein [Streptomyces sp. WM6368]KOU21780.1 hypothetical protein ADK51_21700 [Streptomyces sp. WM6368]
MECCGDLPGRGDRAQARAFVEAAGAYADRLLGTGYRGWDDEFKDGWFDLESAVTAVTVQIEDEDDACRVVAFLDALQVFDREGIPAAAGAAAGRLRGTGDVTTTMRGDCVVRSCYRPPGHQTGPAPSV